MRNPLRKSFNPGHGTAKLLTVGWLLLSPMLCAQQPSAPAAQVEQKAETKEPAIETDPAKIALGLLDATIAGNYEEGTKEFDFVMKQLLPPPALKQSWTSITSQYGKYIDHGEPTVETLEDKSNLVRIPCRFEQGTLEARISVNTKHKIQGYFIGVAGKYKSPAYVDASRFENQEIEVGTGLLKLPGTLAMPKGDGPFPAVVLVQGSGPSDRDETVGPNKPFRDLGEGLASQGIATVRYEKRTKHYPLVAALGLGSLTVHEETVHDAAQAVALLRDHPKIDPTQIYVIGHSLGGYLLPRIYQEGKPITGLISLAGSARPLEDLIIEQVEYLVAGDGTVSEEEAKQVATIREQVAQVKAADLSKNTMSSKLPLSIPPAYWLDLRDYNAPKAAREIPARWLILQGDRDYQVISKDLAAWEAGLAGHSNFAVRRYPKLNHLFMAGEGPCLPTEYFRESNVDAQVVADIVEWIKATSP